MHFVGQGLAPVLLRSGHWTLWPPAFLQPGEQREVQHAQLTQSI